MISLFKLIDKIAGTSATALVLGESGVGKELVASAIHFKAGGPTNPSSNSTARHSPKALLRVSCSVMKKAHSPGQLQPAKGDSNWRPAAQSS